jgi:methylenetetrahydrofolate reductase (NADPH)
MVQYMANNVAGMDIPEAVIERIKGVEKKKQKQEGIKIAVETIQQLKEIKGISGVHIMAIEWEEAVPEIVEQAKLMPKK